MLASIIDDNNMIINNLKNTHILQRINMQKIRKTVFKTNYLFVPCFYDARPTIYFSLIILQRTNEMR